MRLPLVSLELSRRLESKGTAMVGTCVGARVRVRVGGPGDWLGVSLRGHLRRRVQIAAVGVHPREGGNELRLLQVGLGVVALLGESKGCLRDRGVL